MNWRIERLERLAELRDKGALSENEFNAEKAKLLESEGDESAVPRGPTPQFVEEAEPNPVEQKIGLIREMPHPLKWLSLAVVTLGIVAILAKVGAALAIAVALGGVVLLGYGSAKQSKNARNMAFIAFGAAAVFVIVGWLANSIMPRPTTSQLSLADYEQCSDDDTFEKVCSGRFVVWDGLIDNQFDFGDGYVRVDLGERSVDVYGLTINKGDRFDGMKVRFSGYLTQNNMVYDDVTSGKLVQTLNAASDVRNGEIASGELPSADECASERQSVHIYDEIEAMCHRITAGSAGASFGASACYAEKVSRLQACGIKIERSPF
jgi:hypothetical protein